MEEMDMAAIVWVCCCGKDRNIDLRKNNDLIESCPRSASKGV